MLRSILGVIAGYATWTLVWLGGNALLVPTAGASISEGERLDDVGVLAVALVLSIVCSFAGGVVVARVAGGPARTPAIVLGGLLLLTGIGVQASAWSLMPVWYHLIFLVLLVPVTLLGARVGAGEGTESVARDQTA